MKIITFSCVKETSFIEQNKKKWARFEKLSGNKNNDPDEVSELFTEITEDLSYARTFYPRRSVRVYLNQLAQGVFTSLYRQRKQPLGSFAKFWTQTVPLEMYRARHLLLTAFIFFCVSALIGAASQHYDNDFVRIILGDGYVEETERRIEAGDPMGVYGEMGQSTMFFAITINNIRVAFIAFVLGITFGIGTFFLLLRNGVMLGSFQYWFKTKGLLLTSFLTIWIHGAFEISAIVVAGAAGLTVGNGLVFPKSFTRLQSLIFSAKRGLIIMSSLIPVFIIAGFLESYVTRHYQSMPDLLKWMIILTSFAIMIFYYVIFPYIVAKKHPDKIELKEIPRFIPKREIEYFKIRNTGEIFTDTFYLFVQNISRISRIFFSVIFPLIIVLVTVIYVLEFHRFDHSNMTWYRNFGTLFGTHSDFEYYKLFGWSLILTLLIGTVYFAVNNKEEENLISAFLKFIIKPFIWLYLFSLMLFASLIFSNGGIIFLSFFVYPFLLMIPMIILHQKTNFFSAFINCFKMGGKSYGDTLGSVLVFALITVIFFFALVNPMGGFLDLIASILKEFIITVTPDYNGIIQLVSSFVFLLFIFFMLSILILSMKLSFYNSVEKEDASSLFKRLESFGKRSRTHENALDFE